ncbi:class C sortase [Enterococcus sp. JM9B]|uniref:class C sortase n=1 Tax=Enterococcus sp. JM9B TaxID=1857216 RepID=UPI001374EAD6|nr:class C sortase [Enterococcus sp. JM9B]KAF1303542.1 class C sortase [Enterococcus sp. JM9B]
MKKRKFRILDIIMILILVGGIGIFAYPFVEDSLNDFLAQQLITHYQKEANEKNSAEIKARQKKMETENKKIAEKHALPGLTAFNNAVDAEALKDLPSNSFYMEHMLGVVEIPKINVSLPIFDQTTDVFLQKGTSLLEGSSYPTGGKSTHAVLSGHRGLPEAKLFTDLPELKVKDQFFIEINDQTLAYEIEKIQVILPTEIKPLQIQDGRDLVTLLTCTPYMVNTHRLLVTGHRIPYSENEAVKSIKAIDKWKKLKFILWLVGSFAALLALIGLIAHYLRLLAIGKRRYPVSFYIFDEENQPLSGIVFSLKTKNGKRPVFRKKVSIEMISDENGLVVFPDLTGGKYRLQSKGIDLKIRVKKVKASRFYMKLKKGKYILKWEQDRYQLRKEK